MRESPNPSAWHWGMVPRGAAGTVSEGAGFDGVAEGVEAPLLEDPPFEASGVLGVRELGVLDAGVAGVAGGLVVTPLGEDGEASWGDEGETVLGDCGVVLSVEGEDGVVTPLGDAGLVSPLGEAGVVSAGGVLGEGLGLGETGTQAPPLGKVESNRICDSPRFKEALTLGHERRAEVSP